MLTKGNYIADRYEILDKIGTGGMSDVYKAKDHILGREVAVKVLKQEFAEDVTFVTKFRSEAQSAAGLEHANIVNIYDVGSENGMYYIVMEYVEGITLKTYIEKKGVTSPKTRYSYDCIISTADNVYGPYSERYNAITGGGHNNLFQDKDGNWWATMFFNPRGAQAAEYKVTCRPGLIPMIYENGKFKPNFNYNTK